MKVYVASTWLAAPFRERAIERLEEAGHVCLAPPCSMDDADACIVLPPLKRLAQAELAYFCHRGKPVFAVIKPMSNDFPIDLITAGADTIAETELLITSWEMGLEIETMDGRMVRKGETGDPMEGLQDDRRADRGRLLNGSTAEA